MNKDIHRDAKTSTKIFDDRSVERDYATVVPILREGLNVLDVGCGTGAISNGIAKYVGKSGYVTGIDNTKTFIDTGRETYAGTSNLQLIQADLFDFESEEKYDLIVAARVLQWLNNPQEAIAKLKSLLRPGGQLSILDYNHAALQWKPQPPESMLVFYNAFLKWRHDAGMNNKIADDLESYFREQGFSQIEVLNADEVYERGDKDFIERLRIWSKVAGLKQITEEGYIDEHLRLKAIEEYNQWVGHDAEIMIMKLKEVRGHI